jgi:hypothetical protein
MSVADAPPPSPVAHAPEPLPAPSTPLPGPAGPPHRTDGLTPGAGRAIACAFLIAWILCPAVEPMPDGSFEHYPMWQLPIDGAALATIIAAVTALWRGSRHSARLGVAAGVLMAVETIVCPLAGHSPLGWWTWAQTGLSLFVLCTSVALIGRRSTARQPLSRSGGRPPA